MTQIHKQSNVKNQKYGNENATELLHNRFERRPRYLLEFGENLLYFAPHPLEYVGLFVLVRLFGGLLFVVGNRGIFIHKITPYELLRFFVNGVLLAERTVFVYLDSVGIVFLILILVVISLLAFGARQSYSRSVSFCHSFHFPKN